MKIVVVDHPCILMQWQKILEFNEMPDFDQDANYQIKLLSQWQDRSNRQHVLLCYIDSTNYSCHQLTHIDIVTKNTYRLVPYSRDAPYSPFVVCSITSLFLLSVSLRTACARHTRTRLVCATTQPNDCFTPTSYTAERANEKVNNSANILTSVIRLNTGEQSLRV